MPLVASRKLRAFILMYQCDRIRPHWREAWALNLLPRSTTFGRGRDAAKSFASGVLDPLQFYQMSGPKEHMRRPSNFIEPLKMGCSCSHSSTGQPLPRKIVKLSLSFSPNVFLYLPNSFPSWATKIVSEILFNSTEILIA
jgi:hypothetical protein